MSEDTEAFKIKTEVLVDKQHVMDCMCNAFEGGSTYWCNKVEVIGDYLGEYAHEQLVLGGSIKVYHEDMEESVELHRRDVARALQLMATSYPRHFGDLMGETDDAETADILFQLICFKEVVYG